MLTVGTREHGISPLPKTFAFDKRSLTAILRRQSRVLLAGLVLGLFLGIVYLVFAVPKYTASVEILVDIKRGVTLAVGNRAPQNQAQDTGMVDSQVEIIKSKKIAAAVLDDLKLTAGPAKTGLLSQLKAFVMRIVHSDKGAVNREEQDKKDRENLIGFLRNNLAVKRIGRTYVLEVAFTSPSPTEAAAVANSFAKAYRDDQANANYDISRRARDWLLSQVEALKKKSLESDLAVQKFKIQKGLISTSQNGSQVLVNEQQLADINTQLVTARATKANAQARYERIKSIIDNRQMDAAVSEALANTVIVELRNKYLAASKTEEELSKRLGPDHYQVAALRQDMKQYEQLVFEELGRIAQSYKNEFDIASARETALEKALTQMVEVNRTANEDMVTLRELSRKAESHRNIYQNFLEQYHSQGQMQTYPVSEARVITAAIPPEQPSSPKHVLTLFIAVLFGGVLGAGVAAFREIRDRSFRAVSEVEDYLGLEFLGMLPLLTQTQLKNIPAPAPHGGSALTPSALMRYSFKAPLSRFTETLRSTKLAIDGILNEKKPKVIGIISVLPHEGKPTVSKNLASLVAYFGFRTLLIDADLRNPELTQAIAPSVTLGLQDVLNSGRAYKDVLLRETETQLSILPAVIDRPVPFTSALLASEAMGYLLAEAGKDYDYIFVDLPPLEPLADARAAAKYVDTFILVTEWGKTSRDSAAWALEQAKEVHAKCLGMILSEVDEGSLALYEPYSLQQYFGDASSSYYRDKG